MEDMKHLNSTKDDSILVISSAGDNALHYAIEAGPRRIHCVDMNPWYVPTSPQIIPQILLILHLVHNSQGHLVELKLAATRALTHPEFFALFGEGKFPDFRRVLDEKLAPWLSSAAYQFWSTNERAFESSFYMRGYSGWALRVTKWVLWLGGVLGDARRMCKVDTIEEQERIWQEKVRHALSDISSLTYCVCMQLRPVLLSNWFVRLVLNNPAFLWNALGVPLAQRRAFLVRTSLSTLHTAYS